MNDESLNISFARGKVNQVGYPDSECIFVKPLENRHDEFKDKALYVVSNDFIKSPFFVVTPNVLEALGRVEKKSLGIINLNGEIVVPMNNSSITKIRDNYFACNKSNSSTELDVVKSNPTKAGENASISNSIKNQMDVIAKKELNYVSGDFYSQNDIYEISDNKVTKLFSDMSFIAYNDDNIYLHSNNLLDDVVLVKEELKKDDSMNIETSSAVSSNASVESNDVKQENVISNEEKSTSVVQESVVNSVGEKNKDVSENVSSKSVLVDDTKSSNDSMNDKISMPVEKFTNILEKPLDSLNVVNTTLVKEDAPKLIEDESEKNVENSEKTNSFMRFDLEDKKDDISSKNNRKSVFLEDTEVEKFNSNRNKDNDDALVVVPQLVGAIREKLSNSEEKIEKRDEMIEKLRSENSSKDIDIRKLKERLSLFTQKFSAQEDKIASLKRNVTTIKDENDKLKDKNASLLSENDELKEKNSNLIDENNELKDTVHNIVEEFSGLINNNDSEVNYRKVA